MPVRTALLGIVPPMLIACAVLVAGWRPWRSTLGKAASSAHWASAGALALAYVGADTLVANRWPGFPPSEPHRWLPYIAVVAAAAVALFPARVVRSIGGPGRWPMYALGAVAFAVLLWPGLLSAETRIASVLWLAFSTICAAGIQYAIASAGRSNDPGGASLPPAPPSRAAGIRVPLTLLIAATGASLAFLQAHSAFLAQMAGAIAAAMGVFLLLAIWRPGLDLARGVSPVYALLIVGLVLCVRTTIGSAVFVMLGAAAPGLGGAGPAARLRPWQATLACAGAAAAMGVLAIWQSDGGFDFSLE